MSLLSPQPRFRIYTTLKSYFSILRDVISGRVGKGEDCKILEDEVCRRFGAKHAACTPQGRVGIYLAVKTLIKPGQNVVLSPYTIADVINMVICAGGVPVFADIERETCNIDPDELERLIDENTGAVMVTHLHGLACDMERIAQICKQRKVPLIEDAAQSFGAECGGRKVGTFGDVGIYSFGMYKNLIAFYGGMVVTRHQEVSERMEAEIRTSPFMEMKQLLKKVISGLATDVATSSPLFQAIVFWIFRFQHLYNIRFLSKFVERELDLSLVEQFPENYLRRMTPMQARLALSRFDCVEEENVIRANYARLYHEGLSDVPGLILPPLRTDGSHIYSYFPIQCRDRHLLVRWMMQNRRDVAIQHLKNCADLPAFKDYYRDCPKSRDTADEVILLPTYPRYTAEQVGRNIEMIRSFSRRDG